MIIHKLNLSSSQWLQIGPSADNEIQISSSADSHSHHEAVAARNRAHSSNGKPYPAPAYYDEHYSSVYDSRNPYNTSHQYQSYQSSQLIQHPVANRNNEELNAIEPVPYSPYAPRGYRSNEYYRPNESCQMNPALYNDRNSYASGVGGHANASQFDGYSQQQSYQPYQPQMQAQCDYRQPPSPEQRFNGPADFGHNGSDAHGRNSSGNPHQHYTNHNLIQHPVANRNNEELNAIEPVPYSPYAPRGYRSNEYYRPNESCQMNPALYNDRNSYASGVGGHANASQFDGYSQQQSYQPYQPQMQAQCDYRQPPSPEQRFNGPADFGHNGSDAHGRNSSGNPHQHYTNHNHNHNHNQSRDYYGNENQHQYQFKNYQYDPSRENANDVNREDVGSMNDAREKNEGRRNERYQNWNERQHEYNYQCVPNHERGIDAEREVPTLNARFGERINNQSQNETDLTSWIEDLLVL